MATTTPLELEIILDDKGAVSKVRMLGQEVERTGKKGERAFNQAGEAMGRWVSSIAASAASLYTVKRGFDLLADSIKGAAQEERQLRALRTTMADFGMDTRRGMAAVDAFSERMLALGQADDVTRQAMQRILPVAGDVDRAIQATTSAFVAARNRGRDYNELLETMAALMAGSERGLILLHRNFGISVSENLEPSERMRIALLKIDEQFGDMSKLTKDATDSIQSFGQIIGETKDGVGKQFLDELNGVLLAFEIAPGKIAGLASALTTSAIPALATMLITLKGIRETMGLFGDAATAGLEAPKVAVQSLATEWEGMLSAATAVFNAEVKANEERAGGTVPSTTAAAAATNAYRESLEGVLEELARPEAQSARPWWASPAGGPTFAVPGATDSGLGAGLSGDTLRMEQILSMQQWEIDAQLAHNMALLDNERLFQGDRAALLQETQNLQIAHHLNTIGMMASFAGASAQLLGALGGQNKAFFKASQALNIGQTVMNTYAAAVEAYKRAGGYPWGIVPAALSIAWGLAQVATIAAQKPPSAKGFETGTPYVPRTGLYQLHEGERVVPRNVTAKRWGPNDTRALGPNVTLDFSGAFIDDERTAARLASMVGEAMRRGWN